LKSPNEIGDFFSPENGRFALHIPKLYGKNTKKRMIC